MNKQRAAQRTQPPLTTAESNGGESLMAHLLGAGPAGPDAGALVDARVVSWAEDRGMLEGGRTARLGASCLLRPGAGDRVLTWQGGDECWILTVLDRADSASPAVLAAGVSGLAIQAPTIALAGKAVHIAAEDFLTSTRNRHAVENTRTETCKVRVSQVETDIRRAGTVDDDITGTLLQRTGTWLSSTLRDARFRARTFLFD